MTTQMNHEAEFLHVAFSVGMRLVTGVPDSTLKTLLCELDRPGSKINHIVATGEGEAVGLAAGHYLATKCPALVYMQSDGLSNAINPLTSLASTAVYSVPMVLLIGWRGHPDAADEPQHLAIGSTLPYLLSLLEISYLEYDGRTSAIAQAARLSIEKKCPVALLVKSGLFDNAANKSFNSTYDTELTREQIITEIIETLQGYTVFSSTGFVAREVLRQATGGQRRVKYFMNVGAMGHTASIAAGYALASNEKVAIIEGDGSLIMHLGARITTATMRRRHIVHCIVDNGMHESTGGQSTNSTTFDICTFFRSVGLACEGPIATRDSLRAALVKSADIHEQCAIVIRCAPSNGCDLPRPTNLNGLVKEFVSNSTH